MSEKTKTYAAKYGRIARDFNHASERATHVLAGARGDLAALFPEYARHLEVV